MDARPEAPQATHQVNGQTTSGGSSGTQSRSPLERWELEPAEEAPWNGIRSVVLNNGDEGRIEASECGENTTDDGTWYPQMDAGKDWEFDFGYRSL